MGAEDEQAAIPKVDEVELPSFRSPVVYVHARIPPCDTLGHKADTWNVAKPDFTCSMFCCTKGDVFIIRLLTTDDEKFAESFWRPNRPMASVCLILGCLCECVNVSSMCYTAAKTFASTAKGTSQQVCGFHQTVQQLAGNRRSG